MPKLFTDPEAIAEYIIRDVGTDLVVGLPLALGKANHIINALYARAAADRAIKLTILSALTLEKPKPKTLLEQRFTQRLGRLVWHLNSQREQRHHFFFVCSWASFCSR